MKLSPDVLALNPQLSRRDAIRAAHPSDAYKSTLERRCGREFMPAVFDYWTYEPMKLRLPGDAWYTPDFFGRLSEGGALAFVECKGWTKSLRADKLRYNAAREIHNWAEWLWLEYIDNEWVTRWNQKV